MPKKNSSQGCMCTDAGNYGMSGMCAICGFLRWKSYDWNCDNEYGSRVWREAMYTHLESASRHIVISTREEYPMRYCSEEYLNTDEGMDMYERFYQCILRVCKSIIPVDFNDLQKRYEKQFERFVEDTKGEGDGFYSGCFLPGLGSI